MQELIPLISGAIGLSKQLVEWAKSGSDPKMKTLVADLTLQLADVKIRVAELMDENDQLKRKLREKEAPPEIVLGDRDLYYKPNGDGPFCTACYDTTKRLIRMQPGPEDFRMAFLYQCNVCKATYS